MFNKLKNRDFGTVAGFATSSACNAWPKMRSFTERTVNQQRQVHNNRHVKTS